MHATFQTFLPQSRGYSQQLIDNAMLIPNRDARPSIFFIGGEQFFSLLRNLAFLHPHQFTRTPRQRNLMQINVLTEHPEMASSLITKCAAKTCCQSMVLPQNTQLRPQFCSQLHTGLATQNSIFLRILPSCPLPLLAV